MENVALLSQAMVSTAIMTWHTSTAVYSCCILLLFGSSEIPANVRNMTCVNVLYDETMNSPSSFHLHFDIWHSI